MNSSVKTFLDELTNNQQLEVLQYLNVKLGRSYIYDYILLTVDPRGEFNWCQDHFNILFNTAGKNNFDILFATRPSGCNDYILYDNDPDIILIIEQLQKIGCEWYANALFIKPKTVHIFELVANLVKKIRNFPDHSGFWTGNFNIKNIEIKIKGKNKVIHCIEYTTET